MNNRCMLTTIDNPYNPFVDYQSWLMYDIDHDHSSCELLGRIARTSDQFTDMENNTEIERAIDEIIKYDFQHKYKKVKEQVKEPIKDTTKESATS